MKKKILSTLLICILLIVSSTSFVFAENLSTSDLVKTSFSRDTVITHENFNDVLKYYGLDPGTAIKASDLSKASKKIVTVGDLEDALKYAKDLDEAMVTNKEALGSGNNPASTNVNAVIFAEGVTTIWDTVAMGDILITKKPSGFFYSYGEERWWTGAAGADLLVASDSGLYVYAITYVRKLSNVCYNPNKPGSYLQFSYDVDITRYVNVLGVLVPVGTGDASGTSNYNASYIPTV